MMITYFVTGPISENLKWSLHYFHKSSILDVWQGSEYASSYPGHLDIFCWVLSLFWIKFEKRFVKKTFGEKDSGWDTGNTNLTLTYHFPQLSPILVRKFAIGKLLQILFNALDNDNQPWFRWLQQVSRLVTKTSKNRFCSESYLLSVILETTGKIDFEGDGIKERGSRYCQIQTVQLGLDAEQIFTLYTVHFMRSE